MHSHQSPSLVSEYWSRISSYRLIHIFDCPRIVLFELCFFGADFKMRTIDTWVVRQIIKRVIIKFVDIIRNAPRGLRPSIFPVQVYSCESH